MKKAGNELFMASIYPFPLITYGYEKFKLLRIRFIFVNIALHYICSPIYVFFTLWYLSYHLNMQVMLDSLE